MLPSTCFPPNIRKELPNPLTPWRVSDPLFKRVKEAISSSGYKKVEIFPTDGDWAFIWQNFHHKKPHNWGIKRVYYIHNSDQLHAFESNIAIMEKEAETIKGNWQEEPRAEQRKVVMEHYKETSKVFSSIQTVDKEERIRTWQNVKVFPLWHGGKADDFKSICQSGFQFWGKTSLGEKLANDPKNTDEGYFGSGIYGTDSAQYAADIYGRGHLFLAWIAVRDEPFPVVGDSEQQDMASLKGKTAYKKYNAHYVPVNPINDHPSCAIYHPCQPSEKPKCVEIVVFNKNQALPYVWIELEVEALYLMSPSHSPGFVNELMPHLFKILQNAEVYRDQKLRLVLNTELAVLLKSKGEDDLTDNQKALFQHLTNLLQGGRVDQTVRKTIVEFSSTKESVQKKVVQQVPQIAPKDTASNENDHAIVSVTKPVVNTLQFQPSSKPVQIDFKETSSIENTSRRNWKVDPEVKTRWVEKGIKSLIALNDNTIAIIFSSHFQEYSSSVNLDYSNSIQLLYPDSTIRMLKGHKLYITKVKELKNGLLASCSYDSTVMIWNQKGKCIQTLNGPKGHRGIIHDVIEFDNNYLATCSSDGIKIWDPEGRCLKTLTGHTGDVKILVTLKDGNLASGSDDGTVRIWDFDGECLKIIQFSERPQLISDLRELDDGNLICNNKIWSRDGKFLNTEENPQLQVNPGLTGGVSCRLKDGTLVIGSYDFSSSRNTISFFDREAKCLNTMLVHGRPIKVLIELKNGTIAFATEDGLITFWSFPFLNESMSVSSQKISSHLAIEISSKRNWKVSPSVQTLIGQHTSTHYLKILKDETFITYSENGTIKLWNRKEGCFKILRGHTTKVCTVIELEDGNLASCSEDKTIRLWNREGNCINVLTGHTDVVKALIELDGGIIVSGSRDNTIRFWNREGHCLQTIVQNEDTEASYGEGIEVLLKLQDNTFASAGFETIKIWDFTGKCLKVLQAKNYFFIDLKQLKDKILASCTSNGVIKFWDEEGNCKSLNRSSNFYQKDNLNFFELRDGTLATCGENNTIIELRDREGYGLNTIIIGSSDYLGTDYIIALMELTDGTLIISSEKGVSLWNRNGKRINTLADAGRVIAFAELEDGTIVTCTKEGEVKLWSFPDLEEKKAMTSIEKLTPEIESSTKISSERLLSNSNNGSTQSIPNLAPISSSSAVPQILSREVASSTTELERRLSNANDAVVAASSSSVSSSVDSSSTPLEETIKKAPKRNWQANPTIQNLEEPLLRGLKKPIVELVEIKNQGGFVSRTQDGNIKFWDSYGRGLRAHDGKAFYCDSIIPLKDGTVAVVFFNTVKLFNSTGSELNKNFQLPLEEGTIKTVVELKTGLAIGSNKGLIKFFDREGNCVRTLAGHTAPISLLLELSNEVLASVSSDFSIKLWDQTGNCLKTFTDHKSSIHTLIELQNDLLASSSVDGVIKLWNQDGECLRNWYAGNVSILIELKNRKIVTGSTDGIIKIWNRRGECLMTLNGHKEAITGLVELDENILVSSSKDKMLKFWDDKGKCFKTLAGEASINILLKLKDGLLIVGSSDSTSKLISFPVLKEENESIKTSTSSVTQASSLSIARNWKADPSIQVTSLSKPKSCIQSFIEVNENIYAITSTDLIDGSSKYKSYIKFYDREGNCFKSLELVENVCLTKLKNGYGHIEKSKLHLFDENFNCIKIITLPQSKCNHSPFIELDDGTFAIGSDSDILLIDSEGKLLKTLNGHSDPIGILLQLKGGILVSSSGDKTIKLWDPKQGVHLKTFYGFERPPIMIVKGDTLVTLFTDYSNKSKIQFWDFEGNCQKTLFGSTRNPILTLTALRDGTLVGCSTDSMQIWGREGNSLRIIEMKENSTAFLVELKDGTLARCIRYTGSNAPAFIEFISFPPIQEKTNSDSCIVS